MIKNFDADMPHIWGGVTYKELLDYNKYSYGIERTKFDDETWALTRAANEYINKNKGRDRYARIRGADLRIQKNRVAMLTPPSSGLGYLTFQDKKFWDFITDLRNLLYHEAEDRDKPLVNTLLVNYTKRYLYVPEIVPMANYVVEHSQYRDVDLDAWSEALDVAFQRSFNSVTPEQVKLRNEKTTSIGFPYETLQGKSITREDIMYGREIDQDFRKTRFMMDYSGVKKEWRDSDAGCRKIFETQMDFIRSGAKINPANIGSLIENNIITVCSESLRENCPDTPINVPEVWNPSMVTTGKDRRFAKIESDGSIISGTIHGDVYNKIVMDLTGTPGATNRARKIKPSNNMMHTNGTVLAKATLHSVEHGCKGNPSTNKAVLDDWANFYTWARHQGMDVQVGNGDCVNAEVTVTTNFADVFIKLIPKRFRDYVRLTAFSVHPYGRNVIVVPNAYCSAVWYTTWFHVCKGNFEMIRMTWEMLKDNGFELFPKEECIRNYAYTLFCADDPDFCAEVIGPRYIKEVKALWLGPEVAINPKLATDDMVCQIATKKKLIVSKRIEEMAAKSQISYLLDPDEPAFGMKLDPDTLKENVSSRVAKLFTSEHMGFTYRDGMSTYVRVSSCGYTDVVDHVLRKHFGYGHIDYAPYLDKFMQFLSSVGASVEDVMNFYSPVERLTFGKYVDSTTAPAKSSAAVDPATVQKFMDMLKDNFYRS